MKLSDALKFSRERKAIILVSLAENEEFGIPALDHVPFTGTDYGIEARIHVGPMLTHTIAKAWNEMDPVTRQHLLTSEGWEPLDPKPAMVIIAEAACDWTIHEGDGRDEEPFEEEGYPA